MNILKLYIGLALVLSSRLIAAPGEISQLPLGLQNPMDPNLMLLLDSSRSMEDDLIQQCESEYLCSSVSECEERRACENLRNLGFGEGAKRTRRRDEWEWEWGERVYKNCKKKPKEIRTCVSSRSGVMQQVAQALIDDIDGFWVSIMRFNGKNGGLLLQSLMLLDSKKDSYSSDKENIKEIIRDIKPDGSTPLSESLSAIGHYFTMSTPEAPTLTPSTELKLIDDTDSPDYKFVSTPKERLIKPRLSTIFKEHLFDQEDGVSLPDYYRGGNKAEQRNKKMAIKGWCQKNFAVVLTDGKPTSDDGVSASLNRYEKTNNFEYDDGEREPLYLADVAGALWDMDLRTDLCDPKLLDELNAEFTTSMTACKDLTTTIPSGYTKTVYEILEKRENIERAADDNLVTNDNYLHRYKNNIRSYMIGFASDNVLDSDLLRESARLGAGKFYSAANSAQLMQAFNDIINNINSTKTSSSGVGLSLTPGIGGDFVFLPSFDTESWTGQLSKNILERKLGTVNVDDFQEVWSTEDDGTFGETPADDRHILTWDAATSQGIPFQWDSLSEDHPLQLDLSMSPEGHRDELGEQRLRYLRGDQSNEYLKLEGEQAVTGFRDRAAILGDIVHSTPAFVPKDLGGNKSSACSSEKEDLTLSFWNCSISRWADGNSYLSPRRDTAVVYVNANDGMLHAFDDETGKELFAYMPAFLASTEQEEGLHFLTDREYTHRFYNDATPAINEDVWLHAKSAWRTLLASGTAAGGKGIFLLDVTDVGSRTNENHASDIVLWEFTHPELGYTYAEPYIGPLRNGRWGVIIGNGYNSTKGEASVFIIDVEPNLSDGTWDEGTDYFILRTAVADTNKSNGLDKNGMSTVVAMDIYQDPERCDKNELRRATAKSCVGNSDKEFAPGFGSVDRLYAGDLHGNLWAFNLIDKDPSKWSVDYNKTPLFTAPIDANGKPQPITTSPRVTEMRFIIDQCDGKKTGSVTFNDITRNGVDIGDEFGDSSVIPYSEWSHQDIVIPTNKVKARSYELTCGPHVLIMFGTGQFLTEADVLDTSQRAFYAVWDNYKADSYPLTTADLDERVFTTAIDSTTNKLHRQIADKDGKAEGEFETTQWHVENEFGWYVNFDQSGERMVSDPYFSFYTDEVFFVSTVPDNAICGSGGFSMLNRLVAFNGMITQSPYTKHIKKMGVEQSGLATGVQALGNDGVDSDQLFITGGSHPHIDKSASPRPPASGFLGLSEVEQ